MDLSNAELQAHRRVMRECCEAVEVLYELDMTDDYLRREVDDDLLRSSSPL